MPDPKRMEETGSAYNRLRRLQQHSRSNMPAVMAHRSTSTFTLHEEAAPAQANETVLLTVYPQDPFVGEPEVRTMSADDIEPGLRNSRVRIDGESLAQPDSDGNYLYWPGQPEFDQVNAFYYTTFTLRMYERYARRALPWAFPNPRITVDPLGGDDGNAYYNEQDRMLGFHTYTIDGETISTAQSADIVAHEAAHAVLDGLRDLYNESFSLGPTAFHESFADITAVLVALHDDSLVRRVIEWTGGDLRMGTFVTQVAEHLAHALHTQQRERVDRQTIYLRNAFNDLSYVPFDELEYNPPEPEVTLGRQPHNYSRLFTGAFYDMLVGVYERLKAEMPAHIAIYRARDIAAYLLISAIEGGPVGEFVFADMARSFISAEAVLYEGRYRDVLLDVFDRRGILPRAEADSHIHMLETLPDVRLPETINTALASALFLEETIIPALGLDPDLELVPMAAYRNATGTAYLTYFTSQRMQLTGPEFGGFDGAFVDLFGGLTLTFDGSGRLRSVCLRPITEDDEHSVRVLTADLIQRGLITQETYPDAVANLRPEGLMVPDYPMGKQGTSQMIRFPVMYDDFPPQRLDLVEYLHRIINSIKP